MSTCITLFLLAEEGAGAVLLMKVGSANAIFDFLCLSGEAEDDEDEEETKLLSA